jgi:N-acyl-D-aspartate/D-glutamate deacylase
VKALADFASSDAGKAFARIEERFGRDPAASLEPIDDVLAHNLRAALVLTLAEDEPEAEDDPVERTRRAGDQIRKAMSG